jgi:hypothetical protein
VRTRELDVLRSQLGLAMQEAARGPVYVLVKKP